MALSASAKQPDMNARGFMLIEVLIALFIIALLMTALIKSTTDNARTLIILKNKTLAMWTVNNVWADIQLGNIKPSGPDSTIKGLTAMLGQPWYWSAHFKTVSKNMQQIDIDVTSSAYQKQSAAHLVAFLPS